MKIKRILSVMTMVVLSINFTACSKKADSNKIKFVTSFYPMYIIALNITDGIENLELTNLTEQNTGCLHDFQLRTEDMKNIENSDALIINGAEMEPFIDKIAEELPNKTIINSSIGIDLIEGCHNHDHDTEDSHSHDDETVNPHIWTSISNYIQQVENISKGIIAVDPNNKDKYVNNTEKYINKLTALKTKMHNELSSVKKKDIITMHESFDYFAREFDLNIVSVINNSHGTEPSSKEIKEIIEIENKSGNTVPLFVEPQYPSTSAEIISKETGAKVYTMDSCVTGELEKDAYIKAMTNNLTVLKEALS